MGEHDDADGLWREDWVCLAGLAAMQEIREGFQGSARKGWHPLSRRGMHCLQIWHPRLSCDDSGTAPGGP